jgi:hypothetical protein
MHRLNGATDVCVCICSSSREELDGAQKELLPWSQQTNEAQVTSFVSGFVCVCACVCAYIYEHNELLRLQQTIEALVTFFVCVCVCVYIYTRKYRELLL